MLIAVIVISLTGILAAVILAILATKVAPRDDILVDAVNRELPQIQCAQCGYPGCLPYAKAIVHENANINLCPPGGDSLVSTLAAMTNQSAAPIDASLKAVSTEKIALIDEDLCIGCTLCMPACPVDAIVGAAQFMHTVISKECTGCELCLEPCPVDCIAMVARQNAAAA